MYVHIYMRIYAGMYCFINKLEGKSGISILMKLLLFKFYVYKTLFYIWFTFV